MSLEMQKPMDTIPEQNFAQALLTEGATKPLVVEVYMGKLQNFVDYMKDSYLPPEAIVTVDESGNEATVELDGKRLQLKSETTGPIEIRITGTVTKAEPSPLPSQV